MSKNKIGRPTVMTETVLIKLAQAFTNGASDEEACFYADITKRTLYNYQKENPEYKERKEGLKSQLGLKAKNKIAAAIDGGDIVTAKWHLEKTDPTYSTKNDTTISGSTERKIFIERDEKVALEDHISSIVDD